MTSLGRVLPLARLGVRNISQSAVRRVEEVQEVPSKQFYKLKEKQKRFQIDDGVPVYLKGGLFDRILFKVTVVTTTIGVIMGLKVFVGLANK